MRNISYFRVFHLCCTFFPGIMLYTDIQYFFNCLHLRSRLWNCAIVRMCRFHKKKFQWLLRSLFWFFLSQYNLKSIIFFNTSVVSPRIVPNCEIRNEPKERFLLHLNIRTVLSRILSHLEYLFLLTFHLWFHGNCSLIVIRVEIVHGKNTHEWNSLFVTRQKKLTRKTHSKISFDLEFLCYNTNLDWILLRLHTSDKLSPR